MKKVLTFLLLISMSLLTAQSIQNVEKSLFKINALAPGVSYELGVGLNATLNFEASIIPIGEFYVGEKPIIELFPMLGAEFRYFVNMKRRTNKGKNISRNSGNYVSFLNQAIITAPILGNIEYDDPIAYLGSINYGFQRTYKKGFYFSIAAGPAFFSGDNNPAATLYLDARIGWVLSKRK